MCYLEGRHSQAEAAEILAWASGHFAARVDAMRPTGLTPRRAPVDDVMALGKRPGR